MNSYSTLVNFHTIPPPPLRFLSLTARLLMPAGILTVLMNITAHHHHHPKHTQSCVMRSSWRTLSLLSPLKHEEEQAQTLPLVSASEIGDKMTQETLVSEHAEYSSSICKIDGRSGREKCITFEV